MLPWFESPPALWIQMVVVIIWLGMVALLAELVSRRQKKDTELVRKVVHIGAGNVIVLAWWLQIPGWLGMTASVVFSAIALISYRFPILPNINSVGRKSLGTFFYAVSVGVLVAWFWSVNQPYYAVLGILVMTWGDGLAALIGRRYGQHPYHLWDMQKSWEGSLTVAIASFIISALILGAVQGNVWQIWVIAGAIALVATVLEAFSKWGIDNLTVPVGSAAIAFWLSQLLLS